MNETRGDYILSTIQDIHLNPKEYDQVDILSFTNDLADSINKSGKKLGQDLKYYIFEEAIEKNLCPKCLSELSSKQYSEDRGEYLGFNSNEVVYEKYCSDCGWKEN